MPNWGARVRDQAVHTLPPHAGMVLTMKRLLYGILAATLWTPMLSQAQGAKHKSTADLREDLDRKTAALSADDSLMKSARKVAFTPNAVGYSRSKVSLGSNVCTSVNKTTICLPGSTYKFSISSEDRMQTAEELNAWVVTQRLDEVTMKGRQAHILVKGQRMSVDIPKLRPVPNRRMSRSAYQRRMLGWLNKGVSPSMKALLKRSLLQRYKNLPERERGTFMTERAKEVGMPVEFVSKLMNSAFAFTMHMDPPSGSVNISQGLKTVFVNGLKTKIPVWNVEVALAGSVALSISQYNAQKGRFELYDQLIGESGSVKTSRTFKLRMPNDKEIRQMFDESYRVMVKAIGINLNYQILFDDNFAVIFPAASISGNNLIGNVGIQEDIRIDAPVSISRVIDGERIHQGYGKARMVAQNCGSQESTTVQQSRFAIIKGDAELGDRVQVHPWTGVLLSIGAGTMNYGIRRFEFEDEASFERREIEANELPNSIGGEASGLHLGQKLDLGFVLNDPGLSEIWASSDLFVGFADEDFMLDLGISLSKRLHLTGGLYLEPGVGLNVTALADDNEIFYGDSNPRNARFVGISTVPNIDIGYNFSPNTEFTGSIGWSQPLHTWGVIGDNAMLENIDTIGGLRVMLAFNFHLSRVGGLARLYARPSTACK